MKVSLNWLKDFVDIEVSPEKLAEKLSTSGFEVEEIEYQNKHLHDVYVGKITKIEKHKEADRLQVCQVNIGDKNVQIITSATNVFEGAVVPVSLDGADLVNGVKIKPTTFRGVKSEGMFCSGEELGIDENYIEGGGINGILILPNDIKIGAKIEDALLLNDVVFDINVTPNRPDCNSVIGIAREICAIYNKPFKDVDYSYETVAGNVNDYIKVEVKTKKCPRYMASYIKDLKLTRSPLYIRSRLFAVGIKPINTIVDITNYVLVEQGQPMHAFDYKHLAGSKIIVRDAKDGEKISVLNGNTYELNHDDMVIADSVKPVVIAGVIGGVNSCVEKDTTETIFECAVFDLKSIRLTSRKIGVMTDSSLRYSKGVYLDSPKTALKRALNLVSTLKCGSIVEGIVDVCDRKDTHERNIVASIEKIDKILGIEIERNRVLQILNSLGIKATLDGDKLQCSLPFYREDIENENDLAEELIRIYGYEVYNNVEGGAFEHSSVTIGAFEPRLSMENKMKSTLVDFGFYETLNYSLYSPSAVTKLLIDDERKNVIKLANPISDDLSTVRTLMAHALLLDIHYNLSVGNENLRFFEAGRVYQPKSLPLNELPLENNRLSFAVCEKGYDFFELKNVVENLLLPFPIDYKLERSTEPYLHSGVSADIFVGDKRIGWFGKIHKKVLKNYDIDEDVYYGELDTDYLASLPEKTYKTKEISKFPIVERDIAIVVDENITNGEIVSAIKSAVGKHFVECELFDVYRNENLGKDKKSLAYKIRLVSDDKTLTADEISAVIKKVLKSLEFRFGAKLRG